LVRLLRPYANTCGKSVSLTREIFDLTIDENKCRPINALSHSEFVQVVDSPDDTFVRTIVHLGILTLPVKLTLEFVFRIQSMPPIVPFESDDLFTYEV
jgi:hypothetical protein